MTCTDTHPHRPDLRPRAERLIAALDAAPAPQTLPDIMRAARTLMVMDRLLTQLWKTPPAKSGRHHVAKVRDATPADSPPDDAGRTTPPVMTVTTPLNRHQRRLQAARDRSARPDVDAQSYRETDHPPLSP